MKNFTAHAGLGQKINCAITQFHPGLKIKSFTDRRDNFKMSKSMITSWHGLNKPQTLPYIHREIRIPDYNATRLKAEDTTSHASVNIRSEHTALLKTAHKQQYEECLADIECGRRTKCKEDRAMKSPTLSSSRKRL